MPRSLRRDPMFRYRRHEDEIIVLAVRWYISYRLHAARRPELIPDLVRVEGSTSGGR